MIGLWPRLTARERLRVTEVVTYVVEVDDEEHDVHNPIGLVDDEERVDELRRELGL